MRGMRHNRNGCAFFVSSGRVYIMRHILLFVLLLTVLPARSAETLRNGERARDALLGAKANMEAWMREADAESGLLPKYLRWHPSYDLGKALYMVKDSAADLYPFLVLTSYYLDPACYRGEMLGMLRQEILLTTGANGLPQDAAFQPFRLIEDGLGARIFGASEYCKDGLTPVLELLGSTPWSDRLIDLVEAIYRAAPVHTVYGDLPSGSAEINGEMLQTLCRLYGFTGEERYLERARAMGDAYFFEVLPLNHGLPSHQWDFEQHRGEDLLNLRDHGCEIISGLSLLLALEHERGDERARLYLAPMKYMLERLELTLNEDGQFPNRIRCSDLEVLRPQLNDNWGYLYTAWWNLYLVTGEVRFRDRIEHALRSITKYRNAEWEGSGGADGYADSIEGCLQMLNRIPVESAFDWVETETARMLAMQREDGSIEGWYGDGNWNRTGLMYALYKTQGCTIDPWRADVLLGAVREGDTLKVTVKTEREWHGSLRFDAPRHRTVFNFQRNYARINEFPEWSAVAPMQLYELIDEGSGLRQRRLGAELIQGLALDIESGAERRLLLTGLNE